MAHKRERNYLIDAIIAAGWTHRPCKHGTYVYPSDRSKRPITIPGTPSDWRSMRNALADLRRAGLPGI
jgi:hypothetical protein